MTTEQITHFLKEHPLISQRGLETACKLPIGTIRHAMSGLRPIPERHIDIIVEELKKYGFENNNLSVDEVEELIKWIDEVQLQLACAWGYKEDYPSFYFRFSP